METNEPRVTRKREFRFETLRESGTLVIFDESDKELRRYTKGEFPVDIQAEFLVHGMKQKFTDDTMVSKLAEGQTRLEACDELQTQLKGGRWTSEREGGVRFSEALILFVQRALKATREVAVASLKEAGKEKVAAIKDANAAKLAEIEKELAGKRQTAEAKDLSGLTS